MKKITLLKLSYFLVLSILINSCSNTGKETKLEQGQEQTLLKYQCPMDCENGKTYDKSGKCAVCEMDLEAIK